MPEIPHHSKNIVICCDGTGNQFGETNSNVVKLYTAMCVSNRQVAYYHPGLGTMGAPTSKGRLGQWWTKVLGLAFGAGFQSNVCDAYRYLMNTYNDGDRIFLFGFSRGAYTVRALAGMIYGYGLLCRGNEGHIPYIWRDFTRQVQQIHQHNATAAQPRKVTSVNSADAFKATFSHPDLDLHFVGLWDTVSSIGWVTEPLELLHVATNPAMRIARHAISLDERRCFFQDNLWGDPLPHQDMLQVWFAGVHSDVGGSYPRVASYLSNQALRWMLTEAEAAGLEVHPDRRRMVLGEASLSGPGAASTPPNPAAGLYNPAPLPTHKPLPNISLYGPWWLLEVFPHRFYDKDLGKPRWRIPMGHPREVPPGALIHNSAVERMDNPQFHYRPANLPRQRLQPVRTPLPHTTAPTSDLYRYEPTS